VAKHKRSFVVGRLIDEFDEEIIRRGDRRGTFTQRTQNHSPSLDNPLKWDHPSCRRGVSSESDPMSASHGERQLNTGQRRALELLAAAGEQGCTGARLFNHGFTVGMLANLVWGGLATGRREIVRVGHRNIKVARIRITDAGRWALEG
jgi:hypothetical protein